MRASTPSSRFGYTPHFHPVMHGCREQDQLRPGTLVRVIDIKPKYLKGIIGIVTPRTADRRGDLMVSIDQRSWHKLGHRYSKTIDIPASSLEKMTEQTQGYIGDHT